MRKIITAAVAALALALGTAAAASIVGDAQTAHPAPHSIVGD